MEIHIFMGLTFCLKKAPNNCVFSIEAINPFTRKVMKSINNKTAASIPNLSRFTIAVFLGCFLAMACTVVSVDPDSLSVLAIDNEQAEFPPTPQEQVTRPNLLLSLIVSKDPTVIESRLKQILHFVHNEFEQHGNFTAIPQQQVKAFLSSEENRRFQARNVADAIQLGKSLKATFVAQMKIAVLEARLVDNVDQYKANINLTIFTTGSGQVVFEKDITFDTEYQEESSTDLKKLVQDYFKLRGFILETRGGHHVAKISLGRSLGIKLDREFEIRERTVVTEIVDGVSRQTIQIPVVALATVRVIKVMENEAWVEVDEGDRSKVKKGQMVFSLPEETNML